LIYNQIFNNLQFEVIPFICFPSDI